MSDYAHLAGLELAVDGYTSERRAVDVSSAFTRVTTTVVLSGGGHVGRGEDVTYEAAEHDRFPGRLELAGRRTLDELSTLLDAYALPEYRRWAFESAALDLALRQNGTSLGEVVGRDYRPVRFVVSTREDIHAWLAHDPGLEFKVDPTAEWTRGQMERMAATGRVRCADLKGYYRGTAVDQPPDARLYADVVEVFADAVIEDAYFDDETRPILERARDRLSFDAPIHSVDDVLGLEVDPPFLNIKPSRFGSCRRLFDTLAHCERHGIVMYGGGQFELGVGRDHIHTLASLYYAEAANDVAPGAYNEPPPRAGLPSSPLPPPRAPRGLTFVD